jgi:hypothetical protein
MTLASDLEGNRLDRHPLLLALLNPQIVVSGAG